MRKRRRKNIRPEEIVAKLGDPDALLNAGKELSTVLRALEISGSTPVRWRVRYGGITCEEAERLKHLEDGNKRLKTLVADQA